MRRTIIALGTVAALAAMSLLPALAAAAPDTDEVVTAAGAVLAETGQALAPGDGAEDEAAEDSTTEAAPSREHRRTEQLHLRCAPAPAPPEQDGPGGVLCGWSASQHPAFAAYELWRGEREGEPTLLLRTDARDHTRHLDEGASPGTRTFYVVRVLDADGATIGHSNPAPVGHHGEPRPVRPEPPAGSERGHRESAPDHDRAADKVEPLDLQCKALRYEGRDGVVCQWSPSHHPMFAAYRLLRASRAGESVEVFRTEHRDETHALDPTVEPDREYLFVVEAVDDEGRVLGRSRPVHVETSGRERQGGPVLSLDVA